MSAGSHLQWLPQLCFNSVAECLKPHLDFSDLSEDLHSNAYQILGREVIQMAKKEENEGKGQDKTGNKMRPMKERADKEYI